jgi:hypothetical protein
VCVNALINKCIKPDASTIPLAVDEIKKLAHCKYFLQLDGANAYWSIPVCEKSMRLTAFHTPDELYCRNRLLMGVKPSSAVQQSAYLEALDDYIDFYEDGTLRKCLMDEHGNRLKDTEGNLKTLRHRFAVYCDDICAGADTIEELYELFEALICCCKRAGIQVKASKVKFGVIKVTFHNYTITREGTQAKDANLCPIRNMTSLSDVSQVKAFLGCCQQMSQYIKGYGITASRLHGLIKKARPPPKPWVKGEDYDLSFESLRSAILDSANFLHHKDCTKRLFIEVDASDAGWGACAYQMVSPWTGDPEEEGRGRQGDTSARMVIQWTSKAWTAFELKLPVFYRESLARLLALEKYRNLIETNISAGITFLYTDHKSGLYENSLSNKGQLSAWRLLETANLLSIVENLYRTGGKMLLADPLSRLCAPTEGFYDVSLPRKISTLLDNLPQQVAECKSMRVSANKDTASVARMVHKWRKPTNPISQGRLGSFVEPKQQRCEDMSHQALSMETDAKPMATGRRLNSFCIGTPHADTGVREIRELIGSGKAFAVLTSILILQIAKGTNEKEFDEAVAEKVDRMTKLIMASTADAWLIHLPGMIRKHEIFTAEQLIQDIENLDDLTYSMEDHQDTSQDGCEPHPLSFCLFSVPKLDSTAAKRLDFPSLLYRKLKKKANARELHSRPLLVQTRAQAQACNRERSCRRKATAIPSLFLDR